MLVSWRKEASHVQSVPNIRFEFRGGIGALREDTHEFMARCLVRMSEITTRELSFDTRKGNAAPGFTEWKFLLFLCHHRLLHRISVNEVDTAPGGQ
mmetsp:Transcript_8166/g.16466  ORF Transcript_8166/g.16466 Transcript_8166/m.16466 type:complete len:96 (+) Transcript_8166:1321-1608(+)